MGSIWQPEKKQHSKILLAITSNHLDDTVVQSLWEVSKGRGAAALPFFALTPQLKLTSPQKAKENVWQADRRPNRTDQTD